MIEETQDPPGPAPFPSRTPGRGGQAASHPLIVCASTQAWEETWFRKQHFMSRLAQRRPVLYVEPSYSMLRRPEGPAPNPWFRPRIISRGPSLWTLLPPRGLPFWTHPSVSRLQYRLWGDMLRRSAGSLGFSRTWLWIYKPHFIQSASTLRPERIIFDLVDDLGAYAGRFQSARTIRACVETAIESADLVFTTSAILSARYAGRTRTGEMPVVPNGVKGDWIDRPLGPEPEDLKGLPHPRLGFVGAVFTYLDYDLMIEAARAFPTGSLTVVGPVLEPASAARLAAEPNVHLLGPKPQNAVPDYISWFDVCLNPFRPGPVRRAVNPLKLYEYLARGKPVVSTPMESLEGEAISKRIRFAETPTDFVAALRAALAEARPEDEAARREAVRPYSWEALSEKVERILERAEAGWNSESGPAEVRGRPPGKENLEAGA